MTGVELLTLVADQRVIEVERDTDDRPQSLGLTVRVDGEKRWGSEEPGWRDVGCGITGHDVFVWSARRLVVVPLSHKAAVRAFDSDEDIVIASPVTGAWLLVCETSLRLVGAAQDSRLELSDVVEEASWDGDRLRLRCADGSETWIGVDGHRLEPDPRSE